MPLHLRAQRSERPEARHLAAHQLEEAALVAALDLLLVEERELLLVALPEPGIPGDVVEAIFLAPGEVDAQDAGVLVAGLGPLHARGLAAALLRPTTDLVVVGRRLALVVGHAVRCPRDTRCLTRLAFRRSRHRARPGNQRRLP